jgi:hypothetical protein
MRLIHRRSKSSSDADLALDLAEDGAEHDETTVSKSARQRQRTPADGAGPENELWPRPPQQSCRPRLERQTWRPTRLPPVPEQIPDASPNGCKAHDAADSPAYRRSDSDMSAANTPTCAGEDQKREPWLEACDRFTLKASADHRDGVNAMFSIEHCVLTLSSCPIGASPVTILSQVPVEHLAVGMKPGRENMFTIATLHKNTLYDEIYCFADGQAKRNQWIAVFREMDVPIFDLSVPFDRRRAERLLLQRPHFDNDQEVTKRFKEVWGRYRFKEVFGKNVCLHT